MNEEQLALPANTRTPQQLEAIEAVIRAKKSQFGVTAIKVELEANLHRNWDTGECFDYMMEQMRELGLSYYDEDSWFTPSHGGYDSNWHPKFPLTYGEFYNDGSVDSEFTFTLMLDNPENVLLLPKIIDIWNELCEQAGDRVDIQGAGMHLAFLYDPNGHYRDPREGHSSRNREDDGARYQNFKKSMGLMLPALYFLGANSDTTRGLSFRTPSVSHDTHRAAIDFRGGALEFRVFDTCYETPNQILDNVIVMSRCIRYWSSSFRPTGMEKICRSVRFGVDNGAELSRLYTSVTHIDLLNAGLDRLKPKYLTIREIKAKRGFKEDKNRLKTAEIRYAKQAENEYGEYEERFEWQIKAKKAHYLYLQYDNQAYVQNRLSEADIEAAAEQHLKPHLANKQSTDDYIKYRLDDWKNGLQGKYTLSA